MTTPDDEDEKTGDDPAPAEAPPPEPPPPEPPKALDVTAGYRPIPARDVLRRDRRAEAAMRNGEA